MKKKTKVKFLVVLKKIVQGVRFMCPKVMSPLCYDIW